MSKIEVDTIDSRSGSATLTLGSANATTLALNSGITTLPSAMTNTPFFEARRSGAHSFSAGTPTKVPFNVAYIDSDSAFDTSNNRFTVPSGKAGKYLFIASVYQEVPSNDDRVFCLVYKNGSQVYATGLWGKTSKCTAMASCYQDLAEGDYIEIYTNTEGSGTVSIDPSDNYTRFTGMRVIGA